VAGRRELTAINFHKTLLTSMEMPGRRRDGR
jgi:hypothetical protein